MRTVLFTWNYPEACAGKLRYLCMRLGMTWREVLPGEDGLPLRRLKPDASSESPAADAERAFGAPMLLFAGFTMQDLDRFTKAYREAGLPVAPLKAMMTPTNSLWTALQLYEELSQEHEAMTGERVGRDA